MKILLCSINSKYIHSSLGVWYLNSAFKTASSGDTLQIYETTINNHVEDIVMDISGFNADVIGFSAYIWNIEYIKKITETIKLISPKVKIFFGGPEAGFDAENLIKTTDVDMIIKGEGEKAFLKLIKQKFTTKEKIIFETNTNYFNPYTKEYFDALNGRICYLETSRGCPFGCTFCLSGRQDNVRFFDMDISKQNILSLANSQTQTVKFVDRTFNCDDKRAAEIFKFIVDSNANGKIPNDIVFHFEVEADLFSQETLDYLKTVPTGLFQFEAGLQSFNEKTLKAVNRRHNVQRLVKNLETIAKMGNIHLHIDLIAGLPYENYESFKQGFNLAYKIKANVIQLGFLKLLKGSILEKEKQEYNYKHWQYAPYQVVSNKDVSYTDLIKLKTAEQAVERILNSGKFTITLEYVFETLEIRPYDFFFEIGVYIKQKSIPGIGLEEYSMLVYQYLVEKKQVNPQILRDKMAIDRLSTDKNGKLFKFLHIPDDNLKSISAALKTTVIDEQNTLQEKIKQGKIGFCVIYSGQEKQVVITDYTKINKVTKRYNTQIIPMSMLNIYK